METTVEKDFSLLRPFDLEAAKAGDFLCWFDSEDGPLQYVGPSISPVSGGCFKWMPGSKYAGSFETYSQHSLRMAPLCWIEGKPVYRGDVLYRKDFGHKRAVAECMFRYGREYLKFKGGGNARLSDGGITLTWTPPMIKREGWINIYPNARDYRGACHARTNGAYPSIDLADKFAGSDRIACSRIEWEEPAK